MIVNCLGFERNLQQYNLLKIENDFVFQLLHCILLILITLPKVSVSLSVIWKNYVDLTLRINLSKISAAEIHLSLRDIISLIYRHVWLKHLASRTCLPSWRRQYKEYKAQYTPCGTTGRDPTLQEVTQCREYWLNRSEGSFCSEWRFPLCCLRKTRKRHRIIYTNLRGLYGLECIYVKYHHKYIYANVNFYEISADRWNHVEYYINLNATYV